MKLRNLIFIAFIIPLIIYSEGLNIFAMKTDFSTSEMNLENQHTFLSNINLSLIADEPQKRTILCFDVNSNGMIAIGSAASENKYISVYDSTGEFQYGYTFNCNQSFGVQWDNTNLIICFVKNDVAASFDSNGNNTELRIIENTDSNNSYWNNSVFSREKTIDSNSYTIKNNMGALNIFASSYSQLIKTDAQGNETVLYDVSTIQLTQTVFIIIAAVVFVLIAITAIIWHFLRAKRK